MGKHISRALIFLAVIGILVASGLVLIDYFITRENFPRNCYIGRIDVSSLNRAEALQKLDQAYVDEIFPGTITLYYHSADMRFLPSELGLKVNTQASVSRAFRELKKETYLKDLAGRLSQPGKLHAFGPVLDVDDYLLENFLEEVSRSIRRTPSNANINLMAKGAYVIKKEIWGAEIDIGKSIKNIKESLKEHNYKIELAAKLHEPHIKYADLAEHPPISLLSKYRTIYGSHDSPNRIHNIKTIAKKVSGTILLSGEVFSLLDKVGKFDRESGFREAYVIVGGDELVPELGGGACQIGTTLYNAVALADLAVIQRRNHSIYFGIYPLGRDATVYPPYLDFKFKNDTGCPILIQAIATDRALVFKIFGTKQGDKKVEFSPTQVTYYSDKGKSSHYGRPPIGRPFSTLVYRIVKENGQVIKKETISSYYKLDGDRSKVKIRRHEPR